MDRVRPTLGRLAVAIAILLAWASPAPAAAVNPVIDITPVDPVGTVLMVHQGGWAGPDRAKQEALMDFPGRLFLDRHWRVVSVDYAAGKAGLQSVLDAIGAELTAPASGGPLCLYGESAGAHLSLLASAQLPSVDCVVAFGAPTDFAAYAADVADGDNPVAAANYDALVHATFGDPGDATAPWEPAKVASRINADVLMARQADDDIVPAGQLSSFVAALPVVGTLVTAVGDVLDPSQHYMHGTLSDTARAQLSDALGAFADRAVANAQIAAWGRRQGCPQPNAAFGRIGTTRLTRAVTCLVNRARRRAGTPALRATRSTAGGRRTAVRVVGQVTAARVARALLDSGTRRRRVTRRGPRTLALRVAQSPQSTVTLTLR